MRKLLNMDVQCASRKRGKKRCAAMVDTAKANRFNELLGQWLCEKHFPSKGGWEDWKVPKTMLSTIGTDNFMVKLAPT